jgi:hypothetical protein
MEGPAQAVSGLSLHNIHPYKGRISPQGLRYIKGTVSPDLIGLKAIWLGRP